jgi:DNA damage-binding protein 1
MQVKLLSLPGLTPVVTEELGSEVIPRSVALAEFEGQAYVLCGLGDGQLHNWRLDAESSSLSGEWDHQGMCVIGTVNPKP